MIINKITPSVDYNSSFKSLDTQLTNQNSIKVAKVVKLKKLSDFKILEAGLINIPSLPDKIFYSIFLKLGMDLLSRLLEH